LALTILVPQGLFLAPLPVSVLILLRRLPLLPLALLPGRLGPALLLWRGSRWLRRVPVST
jgi:hypothetical protein